MSLAAPKAPLHSHPGSPSSIRERTVQMLNAHQWVVLVGILALALGLRLWNLNLESAWIDEAYSIALARRSIPEIIQGTIADQHPPLYYLVLHFWLLLSSGVVHARLLSVLLGVLHVAQTIQLGRKLGGFPAGAAAGLLLAVSATQIYYSQEVRMYILLAVLTTAATSELWDLLAGKGSWLRYGLYCLLSIYTQYFAFFVLLAHGVWVVWCALRESPATGQSFWKPIRSWIGTLIGVGVAFSPWIPIVWMQVRTHPVTWIGPITLGEVRDTLLRLLLGNAVLGLPSLLRWFGLLLLIGITAFSAIQIRRRYPSESASFAFLILWALIPFSVVALASLFTPLFQYKQFVLLLSPLLLLTVIIARRVPVSLGALFLSGVLVSSLVSGVYQSLTPSKDDWRAATAYLEQNLETDEIILANPAASRLALELYWSRPLPMVGYPTDYNLLTGGWKGTPLTANRTEQLLQPLMATHHGIWLVEFYPEFWDAGGNLAAWLDHHSQQLNDQSFGHLRVRRYRLPEGKP